MKKLMMSVFVVALTLSASAQKGNKDNKIKFSIGGEFGAVTGNLQSNYSLGIGPTVQIEYKINDAFSATLQPGVLLLVGKAIPGRDYKAKSQTILPVLGGVKYYFMPKFFGAAQIGAAIFTTSGNNGTRFAFSPAAGYKVNDKFEVSLKYTGFIGQSYVLTNDNRFLTPVDGESGVFGIRVSYTL
jgi:hypothetical protein